MKIFDAGLEKTETALFVGDACKDFNAFMENNPYGKAIFIIDENVLEIHGDRIKKEIKEFSPERTAPIPWGESSKSIKTLETLYNRLSKMEADRDDLVVAIGGGVVGDIAGFAAGTFKRGLDYVNVPTTLLAQVDSSIGGKTAVNLEAGKNLVGMFHQPKAVFADKAFLKTLSKEAMLEGMAEMAKYGCIGDKEFFSYMKKIVPGEFLEKNALFCVEKALLTKMKYVAEDEKDRGRRMLLNFGHTIAHVLETMAGHEPISHGKAVACGMLQITRLSEEKGLTEPGTAEGIEEILSALGFDIASLRQVSFCKEAFDIMRQDKKTIDGCLNLVLLKRIGEAFIHRVPVEDIEAFFWEKRG